MSLTDSDCTVTDEDLATLVANIASVIHPADPGAAEDCALRLVERILLPQPALCS